MNLAMSPMDSDLLQPHGGQLVMTTQVTLQILGLHVSVAQPFGTG